jgi:alkaline phosphatase D
VGVEFCGTSITSHSGKSQHTAQILADNPHFVFAESQSRGYGVAEFTEKQLEVHLRVVDDVTQPDTRISTLSQFVVQAGRPVIERA